MKKSNSILLGLFLTMILALSVNAQEDWGWVSHFSLKYSGPDDIVIKNLSEQAREIPIPTASGNAEWATIQKAQYNSNGMFNLGSGFAFLNKKMRLSLEMIWMLYPIVIQEENCAISSSDPSGSKDFADCYVKMDERSPIPASGFDPLDLFDNLTPEISLDIVISKKNLFFLGAAVSYFNLQLENGKVKNYFDTQGGDRKDYQIDNRYILGYYLPVTFNVRWHYASLGICYPVQLYRTPLGRESDIRMYPTFVIKIECFDIDDCFNHDRFER
jgi:hypothetical protein